MACHHASADEIEVTPEIRDRCVAIIAGFHPDWDDPVRVFKEVLDAMVADRRFRDAARAYLRAMPARNSVRLTVDVTPELNEKLQKIAEQIGGTKSDVFRKAIALLDVAHKAKVNGKHVGIAGKETALETEFVNL